MNERQEKAAKIGQQLFGERFPVEKYLKWARFEERVKSVEDGKISYPGCGHIVGIDNKERVKLSLSNGHCPKGLCPACRMKNYEDIKAKAAAREKALVSLSELWPAENEETDETEE